MPPYASNEKSKNLLALLQHKLVEIIVIFVEGQFSTGKLKRTLSGANTLNTLFFYASINADKCGDKKMSAVND